ncbi:TonB-dependent receptor [Sphingomonas donggukensis]|uniref:TonB-dependent receptor n=1 Tax=Sphingomonas donggukensis TaxID=2949093 RepID=A0ABY4TXN4_9SPHN|nr:TonB-dependent receptor [Sphingomonas donggukensis]URW76272.1 TonB-dependent receptor [Sphingomonas donggukensis]
MKTFAALCLASTAFVAPAALAQTATPPASTASTPPAEATQDATSAPQPAPQDAPIEVSAPGQPELEDIVVVGRNIPDVVRATPQVVSVLSAADIARTGEGDIAGALQRVTGLSLVGNGFVFVRGLGDRYSSSLLNGSPLPSPEPLRRVVPLDIFPTNVIASSLVQKSYSANYAGEFGGGVINLTTLAVPEKSFLQIGGAISADTVTTSELGYVYDGGRHDWTGFDSGERTVPGFIKAAGAAGTSVTNAADLINLSNAPTTLLLANNHIPANWSGDMSFGTSVDVGGVRLGIIGAGGINNGWRTRDATQQVTDAASGALVRDFRTVLTDNRVIVNGLIGLGAQFGEHKIRFTNLYIHDTLKQGRLARGNTSNIGVLAGGIQPFVEQNTNWFERQLFDSQLVGEFRFDDLSVDLRGSYANTKRNSPYERAFTYQYDSALAKDYVNNLSGLMGASVNFSELDETLWSGQADVTYKLPTARPVSLSAGYYYSDTSRDSTRYTFRYQLPGGVALNPVAAQQRPDFLLSDSSIQRFGIILQNTSTALGASAYDAALTIHAGYGQVEGEVLDGLRATAGVRYEKADEQVNTIGGTRNTRLNNGYWLPALTVTWNFAADQQLRLHGSKTLARPQFRELAPQIYQDFESDRQFFGNPLLVDSQLYNAEARYEWFFARDQRVTLAGFFKKIDNPIEAIAFFPAGTDSLQTGFSNAPSAKLYGAEVEVQKYFPLDTVFSSDFFATKRIIAIANYTYTKSKVSAGTELVASPLQPLNGAPVLQPANLLFRDGAPLVGQSDHLVNLQLGIEDKASLSQLTFLFNYASDRVTNRGPVSAGGGVRLPDLKERPGIRFDIVARQGFEIAGGQFEAKFEARNLTKTRYQEFQDFGNGKRVDVNTYDIGRVFSLGLSAKF